MLPIHVYVISKPGSDVDGEDHLIEGATAEEIAETKAMRERVYKYTLTLVGTKVGVRFTPCVDYNALPFWAQRWVDEQTPKHLARRERPSRPRPVKAKPKATREDGIDFEFERAMARAIAEDRKAARGGR